MAIDMRIFNVPDEEHSAFADAFLERCREVEPTLLTRAEMLEHLKSYSTFGKNMVHPLTLPGMLSVGNNPKHLYIALSLLFPIPTAVNWTVHEMEHASVYDKYSVPYEYVVVLSLAEVSDMLNVRPMIFPSFPSEMPVEVRRRIFYEAAEAVSELSDVDKHSLSQHYENAHE